MRTRESVPDRIAQPPGFAGVRIFGTVQRDLGNCLHGEIVAGEDPRFVVILSGTTVHLVRSDGARIDLMFFERAARHWTIVHDATSGQFELLDDSSLAARVGHHSAEPIDSALLREARSSTSHAPALLQRFLSGGPVRSATSP